MNKIIADRTVFLFSAPGPQVCTDEIGVSDEKLDYALDQYQEAVRWTMLIGTEPDSSDFIRRNG